MGRGSDTPASDIELRSFESDQDYRECVSLQEETWGKDCGECVPPAVLKVVQKVGGVAEGAFDSSGRMVGFVFGITGLHDGRPVHWSHMLAVSKEYRDRGLGRRLKKHQMYLLQEGGIEVARWTFDPLVARNAHLNLNSLRVVVEGYVSDMYGSADRGTLDRVIGTDRFIVRWDIGGEDERDRRSAGPAMSRSELEKIPLSNSRDGTPIEIQEDAPAGDQVRVEIPLDIHKLKAEFPDAARAWRGSTRRAFTWYLDNGYKVSSFRRVPDTDRCFYVLRRTHGVDDSPGG